MNHKILIVDDRIYDRLLYKEYLNEDNYILDELQDGDELQEYLKTNQNPDLILLDWQMPRMGGLESLHFLKKSDKYKDIPVIIITGLEDEAVLEEAFDLGCIDFLNKPVSKVELNARVDNVIKLFHARALLIEQRNELQELNNIINSQKSELKEALEIKSELSKLKEQSHLKEIEERKRKMISYEVDNSKISTSLQRLLSELKEISNLDESDMKSRVKSLEWKFDSMIKDLDNKEEFMKLFESIDKEFFKKLISYNAKLTPLDLKHCAYIRMNVDNYDLANILNVELKSLQMSRYRLKKKLKLDESQTLREFILGL